MESGRERLGIPRPAFGKTRGHREKRAKAPSVGTLVTPGQVGNHLRHSLTHIHSFIHHPTLCPFSKFTLGAFLKINSIELEFIYNKMYQV